MEEKTKMKKTNEICEDCYNILIDKDTNYFYSVLIYKGRTYNEVTTDINDENLGIMSRKMGNLKIH